VVNLRILFFGTPAFAVPSLQALIASRHHVVALVSQPDRPKGRGHQVQATETKAVAQANGIPVIQPIKIRDEAFLQQIRDLDPDLGVVVAFGRILPDSLLAIPAIFSFRKHFPEARIDFVGAPISAELFKNLPIDNVFTITRRYPGSALDYPLLLRRLRSFGYDLAVDVSCSQSGMGSFLVGFSAARIRVGLKGKWDQWFNFRIDKESTSRRPAVCNTQADRTRAELILFLSKDRSI